MRREVPAGPIGTPITSSVGSDWPGRSSAQNAQRQEQLENEIWLEEFAVDFGWQRAVWRERRFAMLEADARRIHPQTWLSQNFDREV